MGSIYHGRVYIDRVLQVFYKLSHCMKKTVKFINEEASSIHGNLRISSVFTSESGEWKLGGFDLLSSMKDEDAIIYVSNLRKSVANADIV